MYLTAFYIHQSHLSAKPRLFNFGGPHIYFINIEGQLDRKVNVKYIEGFYADDTLNQVSAVVGKNGAGKTHLFQILAKHFRTETPIEYGNGDGLAIFDNMGETFTQGNTAILSSNIQVIKLATRISTIFYSPFLDFKSDIKGIDISLDTWIERDLDRLNNFKFESSGRYIKDFLSAENARRQIKFIGLASEKYANVLKDFDFPELGNISFSFQSILVEKSENERLDFYNTPEGFRKVLQEVYSKIDGELKAIRENKTSFISRIHLQKEMCKLYVLKELVHILIRRMEEANTWLEEGFVKKIKIEKYDQSLNLFEAFLEEHYVVLKGSKEHLKLLPVDETIFFFKEFSNIIDDIENSDKMFNWRDKNFEIPWDSALKLIDLQEQFIYELTNLNAVKFGFGSSIVYEDISPLAGVLTFQPSRRRLSSGEQSLLNMYSRFYDYFSGWDLNLKKAKNEEHFVLLLDEADLGYHPNWKKKFIKSIVFFYTSFFKKELKGTLQIIFTTHDPLTLSDILNYNIVYLDGLDVISNDSKPKHSFASNISDLLEHSFFLSGGLVGEFAIQKIQETINWIKSDKTTEAEYHKRLIMNIDEPIVQKKLSEMYDEKMNDNLVLNLINSQIENLIKEKNKLTKRS